MKVSEIITELRAPKTEFRNILKDPNINFGFECEIVAPNKSGERETIFPDYYDWKNIEKYLDITPSILRSMSANYNSFIDHEMDAEWEMDGEEHVIKWCEENGKFDVDGAGPIGDDGRLTEIHREIMDDNERLAYKSTRTDRRKTTESANDFDFWIKEEFGDNLSAIKYYDIEPSYGWADRNSIYKNDDYVPSQMEIFSEIRDSISEKLDIDDFGLRNTGDQDSWHIEPDSSISSDNGTGAEVISKVYQVGEGIEKLQQLFAWMEENDYRTNKSTGLHINLSIIGKEHQDYDFLKMMVLFDENHTASMFNRLGNRFTLQMRNRLREVISRHVGSDASAIDGVFKNNDTSKLLPLLKVLGQIASTTFDKYASVKDRGNGVFEFRGMGGTDYHTKFNEIRKKIVHMAYILKAGSDDKMFAQEYIRKVFLMLDQGKYGDSDLGAGKTMISIPDELSSFSDFFKVNSIFSSKPKDLANFIADKLKEKKSISQTQKSQLIRYIANNKLDKDLLVSLGLSS